MTLSQPALLTELLDSQPRSDSPGRHRLEPPPNFVALGVAVQPSGNASGRQPHFRYFSPGLWRRWLCTVKSRYRWEPIEKNPDFQGTRGLADHGAPVPLSHKPARPPVPDGPRGIGGPGLTECQFRCAPRQLLDHLKLATNTIGGPLT